jgi:hypothetical protein
LTRNRNSAQPMRNCSMDPIDSNCFLLGRVGACWIFVFPWSSQWVHNVFPNIFTIAPHLLPYVLPSFVLLELILEGKNRDLCISMFGMLLETPSWSLWESYPPLFGFRVLCLLCLFLGTYSTEFPARVPSQSWTHSHSIHTREGWLSMNLEVRPTVFSFSEKFRQFVFKLRKQ